MTAHSVRPDAAADSFDDEPLPPPERRPAWLLAMRDLQLLDGALAEAARWAGVPVTDLDTAGRSTPEPAPASSGRDTDS